MMRICTILAIFFLGTAMLFSQETTAQKDLLKRAEKNQLLLRTDPGKAILETGKIIKEAQKYGANEAELLAIRTQCLYYKRKNDFKDVMVTAKWLFRKAKIYNNFVYQTSAKYFLYESYLFNNLNDLALQQLEEGSQIIKNADPNDPKVISIKSDLWIAYANFYFFQKDYTNQLKYVRLSAREYEKLPNEKEKEKFRYLDYANRSETFLNLKNLDSAEYYARLSVSKDNGYGRDDIQFLNFSVLGRVAMGKADYKNAVLYFNEAEKVKGYKNHLNILELYDNVIQAFRMLNEREKVKKYEAKRDSLKLIVSENQNISLHNLLNEKGKDTKNQYINALVFFLALMAIFMLFIIRKNRILTRQEKISQEYLKENPESKNGQDYSRLLEMLKKNDPAFMPYFIEVFPLFTPKLIKINQEIIQSEIEFCALLKLKIPTNDIARYKYITLKSVQNKKYVIRKKLNIPKGVDIYNWFSSF